MTTHTTSPCSSPVPNLMAQCCVVCALGVQMFDSNDFSDLDRAPSEWVALGGEAVAPFYREGLWIWRKCKVRGEALGGSSIT